MKLHRPTLLLAEVKESFLMAMSALVAHKLRSALTLLGVLVGVFSIIMVMTAVRVLQDYVESELSRLGANTFQVRRTGPTLFSGPGQQAKRIQRKNISLAHGLAVKERAVLPLAVGIETGFPGGEAISRYEKSPPTVRLIGAMPGNFPARDWTVAEGRTLLDLDINSRRDVCVLGAGLAKMLFPFGSALDEDVKFGGIRYTVVGVLAAKGSMLGSDQDVFAIIPLTTGLSRYGSMWRSLSILVQAPSGESIPETMDEVRGILRAVRRVPPGDEDDFDMFTNDSLIMQFRTFTLAVRVAVGVISSIALLAAGIGIMNIMLVSVTERTREIGIRRAIGAKKRNITTQFIMEAVVLCEVGGVIGVGFGILGGNVTAYLLKLPPVIPFDWALFGLLICSAVGIVFGSYPAIKAANLDPVESLRYE
jgi:putative ABC transport system permease protein